MTTVVVKDNIMAADGRATIGDMIFRENIQKILNYNGILIGGAGSLSSIKKFQKWFADTTDSTLAAEDYPQVNIELPAELVEDDFTALVLYPDGSLFQFFGCSTIIEVEQPCAIGSGMQFATAAMDAGASAEEAVRIATQRDVYSGGEIKTFELEADPVAITRETLKDLSKEEILELLCPVEEQPCEETEVELEAECVALEEDYDAQANAIVDKGTEQYLTGKQAKANPY